MSGVPRPNIMETYVQKKQLLWVILQMNNTFK